MSAPRIALDRVSKRYRRSAVRWQSLKGALLKGEMRRTFAAAEEFWALRDLSLEVRAGETLGVIGPNGAGKSTLLKLVSGILRPTAGTLRVDGRVAALIELGAGFHPEISGLENVVINGVLLGLSRAEVKRRLPDILAFADLGDFIGEPVKTYSSGMYARLGFAVAVHAGAPVLLVDEILSVGDEAFQRKCLARIRQLQREGTAILLVSHDLDLVAQVCHRAAWLEAGALKLAGPPDEVVGRYRASLAPAPPEEKREEEVLRYGDRRVALASVTLHGPGGAPAEALRSGEDASIRIRYAMREPTPDLVFGVGLFDAALRPVYGTNTAIDGALPGPWPPRGEVEFALPGCPLTAGHYCLDAAAHAADGTPYDYWKRCLEFTVESPVADLGGVRPPHAWAIRTSDGAGT